MSKVQDTMMTVPFKSTERVSFIDPLRKYIVESFGEDPEIYIDDMHRLDDLRATCSNPECHEESANNQLRYYTQLTFLGSKFKIDEDNIKIVFTWLNAFGNNSVSSFNSLTL